MTPTDAEVDRRAFLRHMGLLTAAAGAGQMIAPDVGVASPRALVARPSLTLAGALQETDPTRWTAAEAAAMIRDGRVSPLELVRAYLDRIEALEPSLMAFNAVLAEGALERARALAGVAPRGAFWGVPLALKDNFYTAGVPTTANSHVFADFVPDTDAEVWRRLRAHGAILVGKTQMGPLATSRATTPDGDNTTLNAWAPDDPSVSPGGSSSGSATAVAAGMAAIATGTQTGGSITNPAEAQGLTGLKPTMGRVSLRGVIPLTYSRDHPGPIARDAMDAALLLQVTAGPDAGDPRTLGLPAPADYVAAATPVERGGRPALRWPTRIGVWPGYLDAPTVPPSDPPDEEPEARERRQTFLARQRAEIDARAAMLETFRGLGAEVVEVRPPDDWETLTSWDFNNVRLPERSEPFLDALRRDVRLFGVSLSPWINGLLLPGTEYLRGQRAKLLLLRRILDDLFAQCDVVVQTSPIPFDMVGLPLIAFPIGFRDEGEGRRPLGGLLGGLPFAEDRLLALAGAYQAVTTWHRERAPDPVSTPGSGSPPAPSDRGRTGVWEVMAEGE